MYGRVMMDFVASRGWKTIAVFYAGDILGSQSKQRTTYFFDHRFKAHGTLLDH
jgi:hypothetical protein